MTKYKEVLKLFSSIIIILFLVLYIGQATGYYQLAENRKTTLTEDAIKRFEEDVASGKEIIAGNYLIKEKNYNNKFSIVSMKISSFIESGFNKFMNLVFNELESIVNEE